MMSGVGLRRTEDRIQRTDDRRQRTDNRRQMIYVGI